VTKGNVLPSASEDIMIQFLLTGCTNHRGGAPGLLHGRRGSFNRRRGYITGGRVLALREDEGERRETEVAAVS
jgi:hypothetical protein